MKLKNSLMVTAFALGALMFQPAPASAEMHSDKKEMMKLDKDYHKRMKMMSKIVVMAEKHGMSHKEMMDKMHDDWHKFSKAHPGMALDMKDRAMKKHHHKMKLKDRMHHKHSMHHKDHAHQTSHTGGIRLKREPLDMFAPSDMD